MSNNITPEEITKYIDIDSGLARVANNKTLYKRMLGLFVNCEERSAFEQAFSENNLSRAGEIMHSIKGMSGNLSLTRVYELSSEITNLLRVGDVSLPLIDEYREAFEKTLLCIKELDSQLG